MHDGKALSCVAGGLLLTFLYSGTRDGCFSSAIFCLSKSQSNDVW